MAQNEKSGTCPRHDAALAPHEERGFKCLRCAGCAGLFVDRSALLGLLPAPAQGARLDALPASAVACVRCGVTMRMRVHRGTEVDICPQCHSVWLDAGEWEGIAKPVSTKGSKFGRTVVLAGAAAAAAAGGGAAATVNAIGQWAGEHRAAHLDDQIRHGGILLWVMLREPGQEELARDILSHHGAISVHTHRGET